MGTPLAFILMPLIFHGREKENVAIGSMLAEVVEDHAVQTGEHMAG